MKHGAIRRLNWGEPRSSATESGLASFREKAPFARRLSLVEDVSQLPLTAVSQTSASIPTLEPSPASAEEEAVALLRIAAEVEGALLVQYLFAAGSLLPDVSVNVPGVNQPIQSNDWSDSIITIAKQEMGHLITVQNLLLSLGATPHVDRENFPCASPLYPFPFSLQAVRLETLAEYVSAEAPRQVETADQADYAEAVQKANGVVGHVSRAGQIYERLFWLLQDGDAPQEPWPDLQNPFPGWPNWHIDPAQVGFNQDRQATPDEWRGDPASGAPDTAIYVIQVSNKAAAREAVFKVALQGEGPVAQVGVTHFDKFLRIYREQRAVAQQTGAPRFARNQADDPRTGTNGAATITDPKSLIWAKLANVRYQMLLMDIALSTSVGSTGNVPGTTATRQDFNTWAFAEMTISIKRLTRELREMPLSAGSAPDDPRAGVPYELPDAPLPADVPGQVQYLRDRLGESQSLRDRIASAFNPTTTQQQLLARMADTDTEMVAKLG